MIDNHSGAEIQLLLQFWRHVGAIVTLSTITMLMRRMIADLLGWLSGALELLTGCLNLCRYARRPLVSV